MDPITLPDDLSGLSDEELAAAIEESAERSALLLDDDKVKEAELSDVDRTTLMQNAIEIDEALAEEQATRDEAKAEAAQILEDTKARLAARVKGDDAAADADDDTADADADDDADDDASADASGDDADDDAADAAKDKEPEPVVASSKKAKAPSLRRTRDQEPLDATQPGRGGTMTALARLPGKIEMGDTIDRKKITELVLDQMNRTRNNRGPREDIPVVRLENPVPEDRMLHQGDDEGNSAKIAAVVSDEALVASGGFCAPTTPLYDLQLLSVEDTPVLNSLPRFGADRGGINFMAPPTLASITTAVGQVTAANDKLGGTNAAKTCQVLPCPANTVVLVDAVYHCLTMGNMGSRAWPELVENFTGLTMAAHARLRETRILDSMVAGSTAVTAAQYNGAHNTLIANINMAVDGLRSRHRMGRTAKFRAWFPQWVLGLLVTDLVRGQFDRFSKDRNGVEAYLRSLDIEPVFYYDSMTAGGQVMGAQAGGALNLYPTTVKWFLAPEGTWIRLDMGSLDLGIVRDSVLNATNDFQMFGEVFENVAKVGIESLYITTTICANGVVSAPAAPSGC